MIIEFQCNWTSGTLRALWTLTKYLSKKFDEEIEQHTLILVTTEVELAQLIVKYITEIYRVYNRIIILHSIEQRLINGLATEEKIKLYQECHENVIPDIFFIFKDPLELKKIGNTELFKKSIAYVYVMDFFKYDIHKMFKNTYYVDTCRIFNEIENGFNDVDEIINKLSLNSYSKNLVRLFIRLRDKEYFHDKYLIDFKDVSFVDMELVEGTFVKTMEVGIKVSVTGSANISKNFNNLFRSSLMDA